MTEFSIATDINGDRGDLANTLLQIADAGFSHVHFCQEQASVYMYSKREVSYIGHVLNAAGLKLLDTHGTDGGYRWGTTYSYEVLLLRKLFLNRIELTAELGGRAVVLHAPVEPTSSTANSEFWHIVNEDLEILAKWAECYKVAIGIEQTNTLPANWPTMQKMLDRADPEWIGVCWDPGHGNLHKNNHELIVKYGPRINSLHLNDNDGADQAYGVFTDDHRIPWDGNMDWHDNMHLLVNGTEYQGPLQLEITQRRYRGLFTTEQYLERAYAAAVRLQELREELTRPE